VPPGGDDRDQHRHGPISSAAWVTLVLVMPAFCTMTDPPYPSAPEARILGVNAARSPGRVFAATASRTAAARPKRADVSQPVTATAGPAWTAAPWFPQQPGRDEGGYGVTTADVHTVILTERNTEFAAKRVGQIIFGNMAVELDDVDILLLTALQEDADRTNVELARLAGLSPAATLNRVRRLKESGVIRVIRAELDPAAAGFPLQVYVTATLARHDPRSSRVFDDLIRPCLRSSPRTTWRARWTTAVRRRRDVAELQEVLASLATRGGQRLVTYLRLAEVKPPSRLPLAPRGTDRAARRRR